MKSNSWIPINSEINKIIKIIIKNYNVYMDKILDDIRKFNKERNWSKFHTPENLAKSICIESAELLENFQWGSSWNNKVNLRDELADILTYCIIMCDKLNIDPREIILDKMKKNEKKYPTGKEKLKSG